MSVADHHESQWAHLCDRFLPLTIANTFWRGSRPTRPGEPTQGWKLHISATVLQACELFERVAPRLALGDLRFKCPNSLAELMHLNAGTQYGYWQVGKFLTVYPTSSEAAVELAHDLHELTLDFAPVSVPFDNQYLPGSNVFYRYGDFAGVELLDGNVAVPGILDPSGTVVCDDRLMAVPDWQSNPFVHVAKSTGKAPHKSSPLETTYRVFEAVTQRGKGGIYRAIDLSTTPLRLCIIKEGRRHGEVDWSGCDGYALVSQEQQTMVELSKIGGGCPEIYGSFEANGHFYFAMEDIQGENLQQLMMQRRRRFSIRQVLKYAIGIARCIGNINRAGWIWNDCKPSNLIITKSGEIRPIDFENSYPLGSSPRFQWSTAGYSNGRRASSDAYSLGAVIYTLVTGKFYDPDTSLSLISGRAGLPVRLSTIIESLLNDDDITIEGALAELEMIASNV